MIDTLFCVSCARVRLCQQDISGVPAVKRRKLQPKSEKAVKPKAAAGRKTRPRVEIEYEVEAESKQRERIHK